MPDCLAAAAHFNPYSQLSTTKNTVLTCRMCISVAGVTHGGRTNSILTRHVGDLGNITTDANGLANIDILDSIIQLYDGKQSIMNRTIVVHRMRDDGGQGNYVDSNTTG
jgi:hypothetical protein